MASRSPSGWARSAGRSRRAGESVELTATEFRLLRYLLLNPRRVLTRSQILDHVWDYDFGGDARVLETYISYLKKLDQHGPPLIHTSRGIGYALRSHVRMSGDERRDKRQQGAQVGRQVDVHVAEDVGVAVEPGRP